MEKNQEQPSVEEIIKETTKDVLQRMGFLCEVEIEKNVEEEDGEQKESIICNIKTEESSFLIGQYGINLQALQHITRLLVRKKTDARINFMLDINSYKKDKNLSIAALANSSAEQAINEKRAVTLRPMSPYERRLVHMELSKNPHIRTESTGEGEERKIIISPIDSI
jgi:spoIIIJ-associated protein